MVDSTISSAFDVLREAVLTRPSMGACVVPFAILAVEAVKQAYCA
jgi:hypothetical protein